MNIPIKSKKIIVVSFIVSLLILGLVNVVLIIKNTLENKAQMIHALNTACLHTLLDAKPIGFVETKNMLILASKKGEIIGLSKQSHEVKWKLSKIIILKNIVAADTVFYLLGEHPINTEQTILTKINAQTGKIELSQPMPYGSEVHKTHLEYHTPSNYLTINYRVVNQFYVVDGQDLAIVAGSTNKANLAMLPIVPRDSLDWSKVLCLESKLYNPIQKACLGAEGSYVFKFANGFFSQIYSTTKSTYNAPKTALVKLNKITGNRLEQLPPIELDDLNTELLYQIVPTKNKLFIEENPYQGSQINNIHCIDLLKPTQHNIKSYYDWEFGSWQANLKGDFVHENYSFFIEWLDGHSIQVKTGAYNHVKHYSFSNDYLTIIAEDQMEDKWHYFAISLDYLRTNKEPIISLEEVSTTSL